MTDRLDPLRDRVVLVTGHTGFKGSWLALMLHRLGARVFGLSLPPPTEPSHYRLAAIQELLEREWIADVRSDAALERALREAQPDVVLHLAAQPLVRRGYVEPAETFDTNVMGTVRVLDAIRRAGRPCVVLVVTSDKCYAERADGAPHREDDRLGGHDPYAASKAAAELVAEAYRRSLFAGPTRSVRLATVRAGNVIGGGDWATDRIVPDAIRALAAGRRIAVRNPDAVRPFQHVLDPLRGYLSLAARLLSDAEPALEGAWNFGPGASGEVTVRTLVEAVCREWGATPNGRAGYEVHTDPGAPREAPTLRLDATRAREVLGCAPRFSFETSIARTVRWYRRHHDGGAAMREISLEDIFEHESAHEGSA